jgi:hypothetical protein
MPTRRHALSLAAVLAATVLTGGAAILGLARPPAAVQAAPAAVVQQAPVSAPQHWEEGGDR